MFKSCVMLFREREDFSYMYSLNGQKLHKDQLLINNCSGI